MQEERCHQASLESKPIPSQSTDPDMPPGEMEPKDRVSDLGELPKLKAEVASFWKYHRKCQIARAKRCHRRWLC